MVSVRLGLREPRFLLFLVLFSLHFFPALATRCFLESAKQRCGSVNSIGDSFFPKNSRSSWGEMCQHLEVCCLKFCCTAQLWQGLLFVSRLLATILLQRSAGAMHARSSFSSTKLRHSSVPPPAFSVACGRFLVTSQWQSTNFWSKFAATVESCVVGR